MIIYENKLTTQEFCKIQEAVGFGTPDSKQVEIALKNSNYTISVEVDNQIVGMGRLIGDGARIFYLQDVFILPDYQGRGIGTIIVNKLLDYIKSVPLENCNIMVGLMAAKNKESFYEKFGFIKRPNNVWGNGMMLLLSK